MTPIHVLTHFIIAETPAAPGGLQGILGNSGLVFPLVMVVMFYLFLIRPQQLQRKEMAARIAALQTSDKVVTTSGIHGIVHNVKEHTVMIKVAEGTMLEFDKAAVASVQKKDAAAK